MTASPTVIALDFVEARQVLAESSAEGRVADEVIRTKLVLTHEEIFNSSVQAGKGKPAHLRRPAMYYLWGMHWYWWFFWILLWMLFFSFMMPMRRTTYREMQSPLQVLKRRYAAGEITSEEYEERRTKLLRDANMR
jgi:putative membrane protein